VEHGEESELANMRFWHALPEGCEQMGYKDFLGCRRQCMAAVIRAGFLRLAAGQGIAGSTAVAAMSAHRHLKQVVLDLLRSMPDWVTGRPLLAPPEYQFRA